MALLVDLYYLVSHTRIFMLVRLVLMRERNAHLSRVKVICAFPSPDDGPEIEWKTSSSGSATCYAWISASVLTARQVSTGCERNR